MLMIHYFKTLPILVVTFTLSTCTYAVADLTDAKSIPKPILMMGLYCNSALSALKNQFEADPTAIPWKAVAGKKQEAIRYLLQKLDTSDGSYDKAIRDRALSPEEARFIKFSAVHESMQWLNNIRLSCVSADPQSTDYEACLKESNSEIYKCYRQIIDAAQTIIKLAPIK